MKKLFKKSLFVLSVFAISSVMTINGAFAASSVSETLSGNSFQGHISKNNVNYSVSGTTSYTGRNAVVTVSVTYNYQASDIFDTRTAYASGNTNQQYGITAVANAFYKPAHFLSANGTHEVTYGSSYHVGYTDL